MALLNDPNGTETVTLGYRKQYADILSDAAFVAGMDGRVPHPTPWHAPQLNGAENRVGYVGHHEGNRARRRNRHKFTRRYKDRLHDFIHGPLYSMQPVCSALQRAVLFGLLMVSENKIPREVP